jgi:hypothetical protein
MQELYFDNIEKQGWVIEGYQPARKVTQAELNDRGAKGQFHAHVSTTSAGRKDDTGKLDLTLLVDDLPNALEAVAEVLQWAVTKKKPKPYERGSWQGVEGLQGRYRAAGLRHELNAAKAVLAGSVAHPEQARDAETGLLELAHIATNALFRLEMAVRAIKKGPA